jgi:hypothetical protein
VSTFNDRPGIGERKCRISFNAHTASRQLAGVWPRVPLCCVRYSAAARSKRLDARHRPGPAIAICAQNRAFDLERGPKTWLQPAYEFDQRIAW